MPSLVQERIFQLIQPITFKQIVPYTVGQENNDDGNDNTVSVERENPVRSLRTYQ